MATSNCNYCGTQLPEGANFCPSCGAPVSGSKRPGTIHKMFNVAGKPRVSVVVLVPGSIDVRKGQDGAVTVDGIVADPEIMDFEIVQNGYLVTVKSRTKSWNPILWGSYLVSQGPRTRISVVAPQESDLNLETTTDQITVDGISGKMDINSKTGSIHLKGCSGAISITTHTGDVNLENVSGALTVRATTGPTRFVGNLSNNTSSFRSTTGNVDIALVGDQNLKIDASTTVGQITCYLELKNSRYQRGEYVGQEISGQLGTGAGQLSVETTVGSILIRG